MSRMAAMIDIGAMIVQTPGTLGGRPRIDGTRIGVDTIAIEVVRHGVSPERVASEEYWPYLTLAQVHAALAYYFANQQEIDAAIEEEDRWYDEAAAEARKNGQGTP
jgi:uncharacterized protein (DUF433 family)